MTKKQTNSLERKIASSLIISSIVLVPLTLLRYPHIALLMQAFEEFGKVKSSLQATQLYLIKEVILISAGLVLGWYLHTRKKPVSRFLSIASIGLLIWLVYRIITDVYILLALA